MTARGRIEAVRLRSSDRTRPAHRSNRVDRCAYATAYDLMSKDNSPAYRAMPHQAKRLRDLWLLLRSGGWLYLVAPGRLMNGPEWSRYMSTEIQRRHGLAGAARVFWRGRQVAKQNRAAMESQERGIYWLHSKAELAAAGAEAGWHVLGPGHVYRGCGDLLKCEAARPP